jgi:hypothetical protein
MVKHTVHLAVDFTIQEESWMHSRALRERWSQVARRNPVPWGTNGS